MSTIGMIVVGRLDSTRLPGKVLKYVQGKPLLWYVLSRCRKVSFPNQLIVATSARHVDDPLVRYCQQQGVQFFRGDAHNVARRVMECATANGLDYFFRINADSPFVEPPLLKHAIRVMEAGHPDIVTNLAPRSYPYGVAVELFHTDAYRWGYQQMSTAEHYENVSRYFYQHMDEFSVHNIKRDGRDISHIRLTIDTKQDLLEFEQVVQLSEAPWPTFSYRQALGLYETVRDNYV